MSAVKGLGDPAPGGTAFGLSLGAYYLETHLRVDFTALEIICRFETGHVHPIFIGNLIEGFTFPDSTES